MDYTTLFALVSIPCLVTGACFWKFSRSMVKREAARDKLHEAQKQNGLLLIKGVGAAIALGEATAIAVQRLDPACNGEMAQALENARDMKREQKEFLQQLGIENLHNGKR